MNSFLLFFLSLSYVHVEQYVGMLQCSAMAYLYRFVVDGESVCMLFVYRLYIVVRYGMALERAVPVLPGAIRL